MPGIPTPDFLTQQAQQAVPQQMPPIAPQQAAITSRQQMPPIAPMGIPQVPQQDPLGNTGYIGAQQILDNQPDYQVGTRLQKGLSEHYERQFKAEQDLANSIQSRSMPDLHTTEGINQALINTAQRMQQPSSPLAGFASMLLPGRARRAIAGQAQRQQQAATGQFQILKQLAEMHKDDLAGAATVLGHVNARTNTFKDLGKDLNGQEDRERGLVDREARATIREQEIIREHGEMDKSRIIRDANNTTITGLASNAAPYKNAAMDAAANYHNILAGLQAQFGPAKAMQLLNSGAFKEEIDAYNAQAHMVQATGGIPTNPNVPVSNNKTLPGPMHSGNKPFSLNAQSAIPNAPPTGMPNTGAVNGPINAAGNPLPQPGYGVVMGGDGVPKLNPGAQGKVDVNNANVGKIGAQTDEAKAKTGVILAGLKKRLDNVRRIYPNASLEELTKNNPAFQPLLDAQRAQHGSSVLTPDQRQAIIAKKQAEWRAAHGE